MARQNNSQPKDSLPLGFRAAVLGLALCLLPGCGVHNWCRNGFKVGPNYVRPTSLVSNDWATDTADLDKSADDVAFSRDRNRQCWWWKQFNDPVLDALVGQAFETNLDVKLAAYRVMQARWNRAATAGTIFPQTQTLSGSYTRSLRSVNASGINGIPGIPRYNTSWDTGFDLNWEIDFWGRIRRSIIQADADWDASVEDLDDVLVTLVADVASTYMEIRSIDRRLAFARQNVEIQQGTLEINETKLELQEISAIDVEQAKTNLYQTESTIPQLLESRRQLQNRLSVLLGIPPVDLSEILGDGDIPVVPETVVLGIPADLLRRRPDIRAAERRVAAQSEQIGITAADLYPTFSLTGSLGLSAGALDDLFDPRSATGSVVPGFRWNILNYGQLTNLVRLQEEFLMEEVVNYQSTVLTAQQEVEDAMAQFLYARRQYETLRKAVAAAEEAVRLGEVQWREGEVEYNQIFNLQATLVSLQDELVQSELRFAQGLVEVYRALGGGWEIRNCKCIPPAVYGCDPTGYRCKALPVFCPPGCTCPRCRGL
ncbi:efflux transporter outer membrane subunit [Aeoliella sp.]|uniref:efflux transporter outer membrane subunit n=1 Tax=Aeoliella sp. TaxID=2795800 RepID=UPI003CCB7C5B